MGSRQLLVVGIVLRGQGFRGLRVSSLLDEISCS